MDVGRALSGLHMSWGPRGSQMSAFRGGRSPKRAGKGQRCWFYDTNYSWHPRRRGYYCNRSRGCSCRYQKATCSSGWDGASRSQQPIVRRFMCGRTRRIFDIKSRLYWMERRCNCTSVISQFAVTLEITRYLFSSVLYNDWK